MSRVVTDVFSTELGIRLSFAKTSEFRGGVVVEPPQTPPLGTPLPLCIVELHVTFNNTELLSITQQCFLWRIFVFIKSCRYFYVILTEFTF
jgi:hypothetical protein